MSEKKSSRNFLSLENEARIAVEWKREWLTKMSKRAVEQAALAVSNAVPSFLLSNLGKVISTSNMQVQSDIRLVAQNTMRQIGRQQFKSGSCHNQWFQTAREISRSQESIK